MLTGLSAAPHAAAADLQAAQQLNGLDQVEQALEALLETRQELLPLLQQGTQGCGGRIRWVCSILAAGDCPNPTGLDVQVVSLFAWHDQRLSCH